MLTRDHLDKPTGRYIHYIPESFPVTLKIDSVQDQSLRLAWQSSSAWKCWGVYVPSFLVAMWEAGCQVSSWELKVFGQSSTLCYTPHTLSVPQPNNGIQSDANAFSKDTFKTSYCGEVDGRWWWLLMVRLKATGFKKQLYNMYCVIVSINGGSSLI